MQSTVVYKTYRVHKTDVYTTKLYTELSLNIQEDAWKQIISVNSRSNFFKKNANGEYFTFRLWSMMSTNIRTWPIGMQELRRLSKAIRK